MNRRLIFNPADPAHVAALRALAASRSCRARLRNPTLWWCRRVALAIRWVLQPLH